MSSISSPVPNHGKQRFSFSGTFTVPAGVFDVWVTLCGGGGGGGTGFNGPDVFDSAGGGGGGSGAVAICDHVSVLPGQQITVTIGSGGAIGANGGTTSFGPYITRTGGTAGANAISSLRPGSGGGGGEGGAKGWADDHLHGIANNQGGRGGRTGIGNYGRGGDGGWAAAGAAGNGGVCIVEW